ncbi:hypothetical protein ColTof4_14365 [Colletotrichum tofieldiae]|nr:hypothetical protein ColTof3_14776 [Colletotrichum tofieldiae]GKT81942.1 hypothetical protein ColTof4_14365 [Colletotrichum tofieldiae]
MSSAAVADVCLGYQIIDGILVHARMCVDWHPDENLIFHARIANDQLTSLSTSFHREELQRELGIHGLRRCPGYVNVIYQRPQVAHRHGSKARPFHTVPSRLLLRLRGLLSPTRLKGNLKKPLTCTDDAHAHQKRYGDGRDETGCPPSSPPSPLAPPPLRYRYAAVLTTKSAHNHAHKVVVARAVSFLNHSDRLSSSLTKHTDGET